MNTPTAQQISLVHATTREIGTKLKNDPGQRAEYLADPVGSLTRWGLPPDAAEELAAKIAGENATEKNAKPEAPEVSGYAYDSDGTYYHDMLDDYGIHIHWGL